MKKCASCGHDADMHMSKDFRGDLREDANGECYDEGFEPGGDGCPCVRFFNGQELDALRIVADMARRYYLDQRVCQHGGFEDPNCRACQLHRALAEYDAAK